MGYSSETPGAGESVITAPWPIIGSEGWILEASEDLKVWRRIDAGVEIINQDQMKRSRFKEEQITAMLAEAEPRRTMKEVCADSNIRRQTFYN
ncbi:MAG: transposase [Verrucomicrobiae bacterium]|nr:transposase [Verrucomicrobiae bacterium]NNJ43308.1 transposase [Akkermansiaceae bacterium]